MNFSLLPFLLSSAFAYFLKTQQGYSSCPSLNSTSDYSSWLNSQRRQEVKGEFSFVWKNYLEHAFGYDSIHPVDGLGVDDWGGMNLFMIESLDTMHLMGFQDWFNQAADYVIAKTYFGQNFTVSVFETTIRLLGGLLSAAEMSQREALVELATELGFKLVRAFKVNNTLPYPLANMADGTFYYSQYLVLSEMTTMSLEFRKLSQLTHIPQFAKTVSRVESFFVRKLRENKGVLRQYLALFDYEFYGKYTMGGGTDSFYEYLYKSWLFSKKTDKDLRNTYEYSKEATIKKLKRTSKTGFTYLGDVDDYGQSFHRMEHLACFFPGLLGLENIMEEYDGEKVRLAAQLLEGCLAPIRAMKTNLAPEASVYSDPDKVKAEDSMESNQLRPEIIESLFYMWRLTHDEVRFKQYYRDMGYLIFQAFKTHSKSHFGYSTVEDVDKLPSVHTNQQPSYFTAEVLKYLYLLFSPVSFI